MSHIRSLLKKHLGKIELTLFNSKAVLIRLINGENELEIKNPLLPECTLEKMEEAIDTIRCVELFAKVNIGDYRAYQDAVKDFKDKYPEHFNKVRKILITLVL